VIFPGDPNVYDNGLNPKPTGTGAGMGPKPYGLYDANGKFVRSQQMTPAEYNAWTEQGNQVIQLGAQTQPIMEPTIGKSGGKDIQGGTIPGTNIPTAKASNPPGAGGVGAGSAAPLSSKDEELAQKIARFELDPKQLYKARGSNVNALLARAIEINPAYNSMEYPIRAKASADFRSPNGVAGRNITAINTAIGHMGDLSKAVKALQNAEMPVWNAIKNTGLTQTGDPRVKSFLAAANAVEGEVSKVFAGKAGTDQEIKEWRDVISHINSPEQLNGVIEQLSHLLGSRIGTLNWQAEQNVGIRVPVLSGKSKNTLKSLGINPDEFESRTEGDHILTPGDFDTDEKGTKYQYIGGDPTQQKNWKEVK